MVPQSLFLTKGSIWSQVHPVHSSSIRQRHLFGNYYWRAQHFTSRRGPSDLQVRPVFFKELSTRQLFVFKWSQKYYAASFESTLRSWGQLIYVYEVDIKFLLRCWFRSASAYLSFIKLYQSEEKGWKSINIIIIINFHTHSSYLAQIKYL
jgi:hypothetical protein